MKRKKYYSSTPYDDVFKTLLVNLPETLIGLVNEMFNCNYDGNEKVKYSNNKLFIYTDDNKTKRITDSSFYIIKGNIEKHYHMNTAVN